MNKRTLGRTNLKVSEMGFGAWGIGSHGYGPVAEEDAKAALEYAWQRQVNFYDTADCYGDGKSESLIGAFLKEKGRDAAIIATKVGHDFYNGPIKKDYSEDYIRFACDKSLERLQSPYIDLYQLHNPSKDVLLEGKALETLEALKEEGKIKFIGASVRTEEEALVSIESGKVDVIQIIFNLIDQRMARKVFAKAQASNVGIIARSPLASGFLTDKFSENHSFPKGDHRRGWSDAIKKNVFMKIDRIKSIFATNRISLTRAALEYVLDFEEVSVVIPGAKNEAQMKENLLAVEDPRLRSQESFQFRDIYQREPLFSEFETN